VALLFLAPLGPTNDAIWLNFLEQTAALPPPSPALRPSTSALARALHTGPGFDLAQLVRAPELCCCSALVAQAREGCEATGAGSRVCSS